VEFLRAVFWDHYYFLIYINDLTSVIKDTECRIYLYADDAKIYRNITNVEDVQCLQRVIDRVIKWCDEWLLPLNVNKCKGMTLTSNITKNTSYIVNIKGSIYNIEKVDCIKDLGILIDSQLTFKDNIRDKINKAYSMIGLLKRNFINIDCKTFILLYKALVRPHLEYANSVWLPYKKVI